MLMKLARKNKDGRWLNQLFYMKKESDEDLSWFSFKTAKKHELSLSKEKTRLGMTYSEIAERGRSDSRNSKHRSWSNKVLNSDKSRNDDSADSPPKSIPQAQLKKTFEELQCESFTMSRIKGFKGLVFKRWKEIIAGRGEKVARQRLKGIRRLKRRVMEGLKMMREETNYYKEAEVAGYAFYRTRLFAKVCYTWVREG
jgi:hypothetical protein